VLWNFIAALRGPVRGVLRAAGLSCPDNSCNRQRGGLSRKSTPNEALSSGDVVFEGVGMLQARELYSKAIVQMTHHPALDRA
jgi:hypothetical protein